MIRDTELDSYDSRLFSENNELIENQEKNPTWNRSLFNWERSVSRTLFMEENSDGGCSNRYLRQEVFN